MHIPSSTILGLMWLLGVKSLQWTRNRTPCAELSAAQSALETVQSLMRAEFNFKTCVIHMRNILEIRKWSTRKKRILGFHMQETSICLQNT